MLKRERHKVLHPLESRIALTMANSLSNDDLHPSKVLSCIGPDLREHLRVERWEANLITVVGFLNICTSVSIEVSSYSVGAIRELVSNVLIISVKQMSMSSCSPITWGHEGS